MSRLISNLGRLIRTKDPAFNENPESSAKSVTAHLPTLFRLFLDSISTKEHPVLLYLDDIQWANRDSMDAFRAIVTDVSLKHVLIVASYRSTDVESAEELLAIESNQKVLKTKEIKLSGLDLGGVSELLCAHFGFDSNQVEPLSEVVLRKSGGNPFYVIQYVSALCHNGILLQGEGPMCCSVPR